MKLWLSLSRLVVPIWVLLLLTFSAGAVHAQSPEPPTGQGEGSLPYDEAEAHAIDQMIMCPVCPAETIDQAQVPLARQMRQIVRDMLAQGATREEILDFFAQRYGPDVLAAPPKSGFNLVAWVFPPVGIAAALIGGFLVLRSMSARQSGDPAEVAPAEPSNGDLAPYLEMVDRQLAIEEESSGPPASSAPSDAEEQGAPSGLDAGGVDTRREEGRNHG